ncbi:MAG TPA: hypothetical protein VFF02_00025 [Anaeromyxobacteraceae bacterium]|nr:hypothetical protein [Anaeromyxobacteraceae bacterium]
MLTVAGALIVPVRVAAVTTATEAGAGVKVSVAVGLLASTQLTVEVSDRVCAVAGAVQVQVIV